MPEPRPSRRSRRAAVDAPPGLRGECPIESRRDGGGSEGHPYEGGATVSDDGGNVTPWRRRLRGLSARALHVDRVRNDRDRRHHLALGSASHRLSWFRSRIARTGRPHTGPRRRIRGWPKSMKGNLTQRERSVDVLDAARDAPEPVREAIEKAVEYINRPTIEELIERAERQTETGQAKTIAEIVDERRREREPSETSIMGCTSRSVGRGLRNRRGRKLSSRLKTTRDSNPNATDPIYSHEPKLTRLSDACPELCPEPRPSTATKHNDRQLRARARADLTRFAGPAKPCTPVRFRSAPLD